MSRDYGNPSLGNTYAGGGIGLGPAVAIIEREAYLAPEVTSRDGADGPVKTAVVNLVQLAERLGWTTMVTYARGRFPHAATGRPGPVKESLAVRMHRGAQWAVAVHVGGQTWSWGTMAVRNEAGWPDRFATLEGFMDGAFGIVLEPTRAERPMEGPARRALKTWGPLVR